MDHAFVQDLRCLKDNLSCEICFNDTKTCAWLGQPHLIRKLDKSFGHLVQGNYRYKYLTPGTPNYNMVRPTTEQEKIDPEGQ
jgi:hypothetical protein